MRVLLLQLDGRLPNLALMRIAHHHRTRGDEVELRTRVPYRCAYTADRVYASLLFVKSRTQLLFLKREWPNAIIGGSGLDPAISLEGIGISNTRADYSIYPKYRGSIGYTQRGCRQKCSFCVVPRAEGTNRSVATIAEIWRGPPCPREIVLLDNDFFGQPQWKERVEELRTSNFKVCFTQGINVRLLQDEEAEAIATLNYRNLEMNKRRLYAAWDRSADETAVFRGLERLVRHGVRPGNILVYMLIGYGEDEKDWEFRRRALRDFGCLPYPMPLVRNRETRGFQRFVVGAYDKRISWEEFKQAGYDPRRVGRAA